MSKHLSVLQHATPADVRSKPFPYIVLRNALPAELYRGLASQYPAPDMLSVDTKQNNLRWDYEAYRVKTNERLPQLWRDFIDYHVSQDFFDEIAALFGDDIRKLYPQHFPDADSLKLKAGTRGSDNYTRHSILMDAMISGNTPVTNASSVRTSHIDNGDKLFSGLFYMKPDGYDAVGGDLTISRFRPEYATLESKAVLFRDAYVEDRYLECVDTVKYDQNLVVLFINSIESVHGVTVRQPTNKSRLFVNLVGEIEKPLYIKGKSIAPRYVVPNEVRNDNSTWLRSLKNRFTF